MTFSNTVGIDQVTANANKVVIGNTVPVSVRDSANLDMRGQSRVGIKRTLIHHAGKYPLSALRHVAVVANGGTVTQVNSEVVVQTTTNTASAAKQETLSRSTYVCGQTASFDVSGRTVGTPTGAAEILWGIYDDNDGYGFGQNATGLFVFIRKGGTTDRIYQTNWNMDKLDGNGASGIVLVPTNGNIYNIEFNWFGYGTAEFAMFLPTAAFGRAERIILHVDKPALAAQRTNNPHLPLRVEVNNNGAGAALGFAWGGQAYALLGEENEDIRTQYHPRAGVVFGNNTNFVHVMSVRHKTASNFEAVRCVMETIKAIVTADVILELRIGATLTGASFGAPANQSASEVACEVDTSATAVSGGTVVYGDLVTAGGGGNATGGLQSSLGGLEIPAGQTITILARLKTAANGKTMDALLRWTEGW